MRACFAVLLLLSLSACNASPDRTAAPPPDTSAADTPMTAAPPTPTPTPSEQDADPDATDTTDAVFEGTAGITDVEASGDGRSVLQAVRAARHAAFDRVTFEFSGARPGYHVEYIDAPVRQCGSGHTEDVAGAGFLEIRFFPSQAHTDAGAPTIDRRRIAADLPVLRELVSTCDFEGYVTWVLGLRSPNRYRVLTFQDPPRIALDVRH